MNVFILAGGSGKKVWPYNTCRNKSMVPIGNKSILQHYVDALKKTTVDKVFVIAVKHVQEIRHCFKDENLVEVIGLDHSIGSGDTLLQVQEYFNDDDVVMYGDCVVREVDIIRFINNKESHILLGKLHQESTDAICAEVDDGYLKTFWGHPRGNNWQYFAAAFRLKKDVFKYLQTTEMYFNKTKVGVGSPEELYLENAINDMVKDDYQFSCMISDYQIFDIDKPWHILEANEDYNRAITQNISMKLGCNSKVSPLAKIKGQVILGDNSLIGDYVVINGNVIIGDNTTIDNGAIIGDACIIGNNCEIRNYCKIGDGCSIGDDCIVDHTSELLGGILFNKVYLYHYGEFYGIVGRNTDLGAGTTVGTLRFDDGKTVHCIRGKKQIPNTYSNACFLGDYSRTGVGAILLPGCKVGCKSVVGSGVILNEDVEDETLIYPKQELVKVKWGDDKYGW
ncbi:MAG: sugar phosphate nucleotidyltransferase [Coprobacillus sp.]